MSTGYTTGDLDLKASIRNEKNVTMEDIIEEADQIWSVVRTQKNPTTDEAEEMLKLMRFKHPEFSKSYPVVLRYMCQMRQYSTKALRQFLLKIKEHPYRSEDEYINAQADYVVMLYKAKTKRWNKRHIENLRKNIRKLLKDEHENFKTKVNEIDEVVKAETEMLSKQHRGEFAEYIKRTNGETPQYRTESDITGEFITIDDLINSENDSSEVSNSVVSLKSDDLLS